jgi:hypothetical protein
MAKSDRSESVARTWIDDRKIVKMTFHDVARREAASGPEATIARQHPRGWRHGKPVRGYEDLPCKQSE